MTPRCERCGLTATVAIPALGAWCSPHARTTLRTWPQRRFREIESENRARRSTPRIRIGAAA